VRRTATLVLALSTALVGMIGTAAPATAEPYPVPYTFLPSAIAGGVQENAPGTNNWDCELTAKHPRPVVLAHGTFGNRSTNWQTYGPLLANNGYCVFALNYGVNQPVPGPQLFGGMNRMEDSAQELKTFVEKVLKATGADKVDLVGHSQGTLMPNYYVKFLGGATHVKRYVSLAPLWHGTQLTDVGGITGQAFGADGGESTPYCVACGQMSAGSAFMRKMRAGGVKVPGIDYTNIMTKYDELVSPYTSGREPGMTNIVVQDRCETDYTEHFEIAADPVASVYVLNALDPAHPRPVPCTVVLPFVGTPAP